MILGRVVDSALGIPPTIQDQHGKWPPGELAWFVAKLLVAERRRRGTPKGSRALTCFWEVNNSLGS